MLVIFMDRSFKPQFVPKSLALFAEEVDQSRCDQLLKRPASSEPSTLPKAIPLFIFMC